MRYLPLITGIFLLAVYGCSPLAKVQSYQSPELDPTQKEELLSALFPTFPDIDESNIHQELLPYVLVKGESHALDQFIRFDNDLHSQWRMNKLKFIPYWKVKGNSNIDIFFMEGYGYNGPIWAYVLYNEEDQSIVDIRFFHKRETRTYGGDITTDWYQEQYAGAKLAVNGQLNYMGNPKREVYTFGGVQIDGTSGSTMTNNGVQAMFNNMLDHYAPLITGRQD
jgi:Na(+)-translocating NADH:ubiquinone oxidoreductase C subunit